MFAVLPSAIHDYKHFAIGEKKLKFMKTLTFLIAA